MCDKQKYLCCHIRLELFPKRFFGYSTGVYSYTVYIISIENYFNETEENQTFFSHSTYGAITADIIQLYDTVFVYSAAVVFSNDSSSDSCAVLFTNNFGNLTGTTTFIDRYAQ